MPMVYAYRTVEHLGHGAGFVVVRPELWCGELMVFEEVI
jgi:hypothetical protein